MNARNIYIDVLNIMASSPRLAIGCHPGEGGSA
jgi:hypothetical protein